MWQCSLQSLQMDHSEIVFLLQGSVLEFKRLLGRNLLLSPTVLSAAATSKQVGSGNVNVVQ